MAKNINSLSENLNQLTKSVNDALSLVNGYSESSLTNSETVNVTLSDGSSVSMPSYANIVKRIDRMEDTVSAFTQGNGMIETDDGTFRKIKVSTVPHAPSNVDSLPEVTTFGINANWFFEDFMFPKIVVTLDLKDKIDDDSDRVYINRIILDYEDADAIQFYEDNVKGNAITYASLIEALNTEQVSYKEDIQEVSLPLTYEMFNGDFTITDIKNDKDGSGNEYLWYYLDTLNYNQVNENGVIQSNSYLLSKNDYVRYNDSLYIVKDIDQTAKRIRIEYSVGYETPSVGNAFSVYNEPFKEKNVDIAIGFNEINILYVKGVNENYNILSKDWSLPTSFITNNLLLETDNKTKLSAYYPNYVQDFGKEWIAKAKEGHIYAYSGKTPNTPVIDVNTLKVVQINTQLNTTLETEEYNNLVSSIYSAKSSLEDLRKTISSDKEKLIKTSDENARTTIQNSINNNTNTLSTETTKYNSLVEQLNTMLNENGAIGYSPKYHIRGFFPIPEPQYTDVSLKTGKQEVIGFDIMYRYIHTDNTSTDLATFTYEDGNNTTNAVFSDWNIVQSKLKAQVFDEELDMYVWESEEVGDGNSININQIDIPIRSGEKVEIKARSISEAGYPTNPLKSAWSDSVVVSFPDNLTQNDAVTTTINSAKDDMTSVVLQQTLTAAGLYTHIQDSDDVYRHDVGSVRISYTDASNAQPSAVLTSTLKEFLTKLLQEIPSAKRYAII